MARRRVFKPGSPVVYRFTRRGEIVRQAGEVVRVEKTRITVALDRGRSISVRPAALVIGKEPTP